MLLAVAVYEGYFGAGSGILILALLGFLGLGDIHTANGLKGFFVTAINGVASAYFIARGAVHWPSVAVMVAGSAIGGYGGARFARRIGRKPARYAVIVVGLVMTVVLLLRSVGRAPHPAGTARPPTSVASRETRMGACRFGSHDAILLPSVTSGRLIAP
jgi:uncharacterized membrane protein YfcA